MKNFYCLSERAIELMKEPGVKGKIMCVLEISDTRTIDKHIKNNFPNSPLMNFNVREIIKNYAENVSDRDIYRKLTPVDIARVRDKRQIMQAQNAKYNNIKK